jgi:hypothetical protein
MCDRGVCDTTTDASTCTTDNQGAQIAAQIAQNMRVSPAGQSVCARAALSAIVVAALTGAAGVIASRQTSQPLPTLALVLLLGSGAVVGGVLGPLVSRNTDFSRALKPLGASGSRAITSRAAHRARGGLIPDNPDVRASALKVARDELSRSKRGLRRELAIQLSMAALWICLGVLDGAGQHWDRAAWKLLVAVLYIVLALRLPREIRRLGRRVALLEGDSSMQTAMTT